jgi:hypothetical protein
VQSIAFKLEHGWLPPAASDFPNSNFAMLPDS